MPFVVIYIDSAEAAKDIVFNDDKGNTQYIGDSSQDTVGFTVIDVLDTYEKPAG